MTGSLSTCQCPHDPLEALMSIIACSTSRSTLPAAAVSARAIPDEIIREKMALTPEKSPVAMAPVLEESPVAIAPKRRPTASKMAHKKSAPVKRGKR